MPFVWSKVEVCCRVVGLERVVDVEPSSSRCVSLQVSVGARDLGWLAAAAQVGLECDHLISPGFCIVPKPLPFDSLRCRLDALGQSKLSVILVSEEPCAAYVIFDAFEVCLGLI